METDKPTYIDLTSLKNELTSDQVYNILSNARRRYTLYCLYQTEGELSLDRLAARLAAYENDTTVETVTDTERRNMYISLYQTHLPKLAELGLVTYDKDDRHVRLTGTALDAEVTPGSNRHAWHLYYGSMGVVSLSALVGVSVGVIPPTGSSWTVVALATVLGLLLLAVLQYVVSHLPTGSSRNEYFRLDELV